MNKVLKVISAAMLSAAVAVSAAVSVSAAGINAAEQKVLDALNGTVNLNGVATPCPARYVNQAEGYFNTIEMTDDEAAKVVEKIEAVKAYLEKTGVSKYTELSDAQLDEVVRLSNDASGVVDVILTFNKVTRVVTATKKSSGDKIVDITPGKNDEVKVTGFSVADVTVVAGLGILLVTAAGVYLLKTSKKEEA